MQNVRCQTIDKWQHTSLCVSVHVCVSSFSFKVNRKTKTKKSDDHTSGNDWKSITFNQWVKKLLVNWYLSGVWDMHRKCNFFNTLKFRQYILFSSFFSEHFTSLRFNGHSDTYSKNRLSVILLWVTHVRLCITNSTVPFATPPWKVVSFFPQCLILCLYFSKAVRVGHSRFYNSICQILCPNSKSSSAGPAGSPAVLW